MPGREPPKITYEQLRAAIQRARNQLGQREFSKNPGGTIYRDFAEPLDLLAQFVNQQEKDSARNLDHNTLRDGSKVWRVLEDRKLVDLVRKVGQIDNTPEGVCQFRVDIQLDALGVVGLHGTADQLVLLLNVSANALEQTRAEAAAEERRRERAQPRPEPEVLPAEQAFPDPTPR
ncbi:MAG: hypothetical protein E6Q97_02465 [Desulfurellales bacterium]|nr:MAG: hypothetical protein E6Q97_02465 [Desulfurellales bacterium]